MASISRPASTPSTRGLIPCALSAAFLLFPAHGAPLAAQEVPEAGPDPVADSLETGDVGIPDTPRLFRIGLTGSRLVWADRPEGRIYDDGGLTGLDVESRLNRFAAFRFSGSYGRGAVVGTDTLGAPATTELDQWVFDVVAVGRLAFEPLRRVGVVPFGTIGVGTVVHDPHGAELLTRSQSAFTYGAGVDADLSTTFGARAEWRRYEVETQTPFDPLDRTGTSRSADRFFASLYWKL